MLASIVRKQLIVPQIQTKCEYESKLNNQRELRASGFCDTHGVTQQFARQCSGRGALTELQVSIRLMQVHGLPSRLSSGIVSEFNAMFENHLDRRIFKTVRHHTADNPQTLAGIIGGVDARERLVLTYDELSGGIARLIASGHIAEVTPLHFYDASESGGSRSFSGISQIDHESAVAAYREWFAKQVAALDDEPGEDDFVWQKVTMRWATPDDRWPTDADEDGAEQLADTIALVIDASGLGEINGFEYGRGHIDVMIFGKATDGDVDDIYELVAPAFRTFGCPPGSRIIRTYHQPRREVESDVVGA